MSDNEMLNTSMSSHLLKIEEIINAPENYTSEEIAPALKALIDMNKKIFAYKRTLEQIILGRMDNIKATQLRSTDIEGNPLTYTKQLGSMTAIKDAEEIYTKAGFNSLEIGSFIFKGSWKNAAQLIKLGGKKAELINEIFERGMPSLKIKEK